MHRHVEVVLSDTFNDKGELAGLLDGIMEDVQNVLGWDYWRIGGRWSGAHTLAKADPELLGLMQLKLRFESHIPSDLDGSFDKCFKQYFPHLPSIDCSPGGSSVDDIIQVPQCPPRLEAFTLVIPGRPDRELRKLRKRISCKIEKCGDHLVFHARIWDRNRIRQNWDGHVLSVLEAAGIRSGTLVTLDAHS